MTVSQDPNKIKLPAQPKSRDDYWWTPNPGPQTAAFNCEADEILFHGGRGCVHPDTLLDTPSGKVKIKDWAGGEVYSLKDGKVITTYATPPIRGTREDMYAVKVCDTRTVIVTDEHKFLANRLEGADGDKKGWVMTKDLTVYDPVENKGSFIYARLTDTFSSFVPVEAIIKVEPEYYWDIHVPETNCYFAEGILHHNSGKSDWLWGAGVLKPLALYGKNIHVLMIRHSSKALEDLIIKGKQIVENTGLADYIGGNVREFRFRGPLKGAVVKMRMINHISDLDTLKGHEYTAACFDEIVDLRIPLHTLKDKIQGSLRNKYGIPTKMLYTANPGGFNHFAVKSYFIDPCPEGYKTVRNQHGKTRAHFPSTLKDNPILLDNNPDYLTQLQSIRDPQLRDAWLNGSWDVTIGAAIQDLWNKDVHVTDPIYSGDIPAGCTIHRAMDWGLSSPFGALWYFISNGENIKGRAFPPGAVVFFREYYGWKPGMRHNKGLRLTPYEVASEMHRIENDHGIHDRCMPGPADNQIFGGQLTGTPIYDDFRKKSITFHYADKSPGSNASGLAQIRNRLQGIDDTPMMYFTEDCRNSIRTLPSLILDEEKRDELAKNQEDHLYDVVKYVCLDNTGLVESSRDIADREHSARDTVRSLSRFRGV